MIPILEKEIWLSNFASRLMEVQPRFPPRLAAEVAEGACLQLHLFKPREAVDILLGAAKSLREGDHQPDLGEVAPSSSA